MASHNRTIFVGTTAISAMALCIGNALAQEAAETAQKPSGELSEVIVTSERRDQVIQEVPLSVAAYSSDNLARSGVASVKDLQLVDPSLNITGHSGSVLPFLRGVGNPSATTIGNEASVPVYIDDVYYSRVSPAYLELANIERVEVLKGPQGTLFGRNASGGLIHIVTREPNMAKPELDVTVGYSNFNTGTAKIYGSMPLADNVAAGISISQRYQGEGWGRNQTTGADTYRDKFTSIRSKLAIDLDSGTTIRVSGFYANLDSTKNNLQTRYKGTVGGTFGVPAFGILPYGPVQARPSLADSGHFYDTINNENAFNEFESWGVSLAVTQELDSVELVSITSFRSADETWHVDGDGTELPFLVYDSPSIDRETTQEFQVRSLGGSVDWIVGAYYLYSKQGYVPVSITGDAMTFSSLASQDLYGVQRINSYATYGQATFPLTDDTNLTTGLRYSKDYVNGVGSVSGITPGGITIPFSSYDQTFGFNKLTYRLALDHHFTSDIMGYAAVSRGYKSGTFNTLPLTADPCNPEVIDAYELGMKTELLDRRLRLNAAVFWNDISDPQVQTVVQGPGGSSFVGLTNAKTARSRGIEAELQALLTDQLTFRLSGTVLNAVYTDFKNGPIALPVVDAQGNPTSPYGLHPLTTEDQSGNRMVQVPKRRFTTGLNYDVETSVGHFNADVNASYTSEFPWEPDGIIRQEAYTLVGASFEWTPPAQDQLTLRLWGKNLTGKEYYVTELEVAGSQQGNNAVAAEPRTYGIEARYKF